MSGIDEPRWPSIPFAQRPVPLLQRLQRVTHRVEDLRDLLFGDDQRWRERERIPGALRGPAMRCCGMQHDDVKPGLITMAKRLDGGMPLSGMVARAALTDAAEPGALGGTYADHSLVCTAAHAVLEVMVKENLSARADMLGRQLKEQRERGLLLLVGGVHGKVIRVLFPLTPLTIEPAVLDEGLDILEHALTHGTVAQA